MIFESFFVWLLTKFIKYDMIFKLVPFKTI